MSLEIGTLSLAAHRGAHAAPLMKRAVANGPNAVKPENVDFGAVYKQQLAPAATQPAAVSSVAATSPLKPSLPATLAAMPNGGLMSNPTGYNALSGGAIPYNPNYYATLAAATEVARQVGGSVVDLRGQISNNQSEYYISLPNGTSINAGNLVAICNNPLYQGNSGVMDHMLAEILNNNAIGTTGVGTGQYTVKDGRVTYDPNTQVATPPSPYYT